MIIFPSNKSLNTQFATPIHNLLDMLTESIGTGQPRGDATGRFATHAPGSDWYFVSQPGRSGILQVSSAEFKQMGLSQFVYHPSLIPDRHHLYSILDEFIKLLLGTIGFFVSGYVFDRRPTENSTGQE